MRSNSTVSMANYFGLEVEVICQMDNCSLIRFGNRDFVVETQDLTELSQALRRAA